MGKIFHIKAEDADQFRRKHRRKLQKGDVIRITGEDPLNKIPGLLDLRPKTKNILKSKKYGFKTTSSNGQISIGVGASPGGAVSSSVPSRLPPSEGSTNYAELMQIIIDNSDYGYTAIPSTSVPIPFTSDKAMLVDAVPGGDVRGFKTVGANQPTVSDLPQVQEDWSDYPNAIYEQWYMRNGEDAPQWVFRDDDAPFLDQPNGRRTRFGDNIVPTPDESPNGFDMLLAFRYLPCVDNETIGFGFRRRGSYMECNQPASVVNGDTTTSLPVNLEDHVYRLKVDSSQNWEMHRNGVEVGSGTGANISKAFTYMGSNGHPAANHFRWAMFKDEFSEENITAIYAAAQIIAPWDTMPLWPHIPELFSMSSQQWDGTLKEWDIFRNKTPVFAGGNGIEGTHSYEWVVWDDDDHVTYPVQNKIDDCQDIVGSDAEASKLRRTYYEDSNGRGNPTHFREGVTGGDQGGFVFVACIATIRDSDGLEGPRYIGGWSLDNIP